MGLAGTWLRQTRSFPAPFFSRGETNVQHYAYAAAGLTTAKDTHREHGRGWAWSAGVRGLLAGAASEMSQRAWLLLSLTGLTHIQSVNTSHHLLLLPHAGLVLPGTSQACSLHGASYPPCSLPGTPFPETSTGLPPSPPTSLSPPLSFSGGHLRGNSKLYAEIPA